MQRLGNYILHFLCSENYKKNKISKSKQQVNCVHNSRRKTKRRQKEVKNDEGELEITLKDVCKKGKPERKTFGFGLCFLFNQILIFFEILVNQYGFSHFDGNWI